MRLQIDTTPAMDQLMDELMKVAGLSSKKELFNNALTLFGWAVDETRKSRAIASINEADDSYRELQMPALVNARHYTSDNLPAMEAAAAAEPVEADEQPRNNKSHAA